MGNCLCLKRSSCPKRADESGDFPPALITNTKEKGHIFRSYPSLVRFLLQVEPENGVASGDQTGNTSLASTTTPQEQKVADTISTVVSVPVTIKDVKDFQQMPGYGNVQTFTYHELRLATKNFCPDLILGEGGFGLVYKGAIDGNIRPGFQYTQVAVKELNPEGFQGDKEWLAEINYLGQFSHPNLVNLIGYCCEGEHRLLVYEYMAHGSLENHLFKRGGATLPWLTRIKIALDVANGLAFLHGAERPIIYRDFKTSNILLDAEYNGKLSDFGLAKEGPMGDKTHVSTRVMGTFGYAAPEYIMTGHLTARSDVYGFGVVLAELLIGQKSMDESRPRREHNMVEWGRPLLIRSNKLPKIVDPRMEGQYSFESVEKVARLAYECLSQNPKARPVMSEVVGVLHGVLKNEASIPLPTPEKVAAWSSTRSLQASLSRTRSEQASPSQPPPHQAPLFRSPPQQAPAPPSRASPSRHWPSSSQPPSLQASHVQHRPSPFQPPSLQALPSLPLPQQASPSQPQQALPVQHRPSTSPPPSLQASPSLPLPQQASPSQPQQASPSLPLPQQASHSQPQQASPSRSQLCEAFPSRPQQLFPSQPQRLPLTLYKAHKEDVHSSAVGRKREAAEHERSKPIL